jgi:hypothetical protein
MVYRRLTQSDWTKPPWEFMIAAGYGGRFSCFNSFGYNAAVGTSFEDIWNVGGDISFLSSAETLDISSSSANDDGDPAGTGAQKITIFGLDDDYKLIEEEIVLDGLATVTTASSFLRVYRMIATDAGSGGVNDGNISAVASVSLSTQARIDAGEGQTLMAISTIPDGFYGIITGAQFAATGLDTAVIDFQTREPGKSWRILRRANVPTAAINYIDYVPLNCPLLIPPRSDLKLRGIKASGGGTTIITGSYDYYIIDEREINA